MAVRVLVVLGVLACLTVRQLPAWRSDVALWTVAATVNVWSPRPALNLAVALRKEGRMAEATTWLLQAATRAHGAPREQDYRAAVAMQFAAIEMTGVFVCDSPTVRPYCLP